MAKNGAGKVVRQASFLMAAHLISSVIGLLYRSPLHSIMGDTGAGYYTYAYDWYTMILLISSYSIPSGVSKVMAERLATGQYRNAFRVFQTAIFYVLVVGGLGALFVFFGAPLMLREMPDAVLALRVLAPTILLSGFLGACRGFFQAHNTMMPTAISQIAEQILNAVFSVLMAYLLIRPHIGDENLVGKYGAAGGTFGTGAGVLTGLLIMLLIFYANRGVIRKRLRSDRTRVLEPYRNILKDIILLITPIILATFVYNMTTVIDQKIFTIILIGKGTPADTVNRLYGLFGYRFRPIINIPIALASATSTALIPAIASSMAERRKKEAASKIEECMRLTTFISIPSAVGLAVLSYPVIRLLYPSGDVKGAAILLSLGAVSVVFYSISTVTNGVLQGSGHAAVPVRNALIAVAVNIAVLYLCSGLFGLGVYGILLATVVYSLTICLLNLRSVRKRLRFSSDLKRTYIYPFLSACIMGAVIAIVYWLPVKLVPSVFGKYLMSALLLAVAILIGIFVFVIADVKISKIPDEEIVQLPMGRRILGILRKLHVR